MNRREQILETAAGLFARHGFHGVSITDLGAACGISGPALYKHFPNKQAILADMLVDISDELLAVGRSRVAEADGDEAALQGLIDWHVSFALAHKPLIVVQDRDWAALPEESRERVRATQRKYVEVWVKVLRGIDPELPVKRARAKVHATFGLINSTPHSALVGEDEMHALLATMARAGLSA